MSYKHINIDERSIIYNFLKSGLSIREISKALNRSPSSISRELKRNSSEYSKIYYPYAAHNKYKQRRLKCRPSKIDDTKIIDYIRECINKTWSPDQIFHRKPDNLDVELPSIATIYRMIQDKRIPSINMKNLRRKGKFRKKGDKRCKSSIDESRKIANRPEEISSRIDFGHWEGDTVESGKTKSTTCFVTLVERKSRFCIAIKVPCKKEEEVTKAIINALSQFPKELVKSITFDRGKEFSGYEKIEKELNCQTYFCDAHSPWQKGSNENTNGLLREFYQKGMDLSKVSEEELTNNLSLLNNRPRKCIGYLTPYEMLKG